MCCYARKQVAEEFRVLGFPHTSSKIFFFFIRGSTPPPHLRPSAKADNTRTHTAVSQSVTLMGNAGGRRKKTKTKGKKASRISKPALRGKFHTRHADLLYEDYQKLAASGGDAKAAGITDGATYAPLGNIGKGEVTDDMPGAGRFYCPVTGRFFADQQTLDRHYRTKEYKRALKRLQTEGPPHTQEDAEWAAGMGPVDNGTKKARSSMRT